VKVLVADDDVISRRMLAAALQRLGYEAVSVDDGARAWEILDAPEAPPLVLLDWNMPGLDGLEICRRVRKRPGGRYTYMILVTSRRRPEDIVTGLEAGADDFVAKPFDPDELRARVRAGQRIIELQNANDRAQSYLTTVLANIDIGVLLTDSVGKVVFANTALSEISMSDPGEVEGATRDDFMRMQAAQFTDPEGFLRAVGVGEGAEAAADARTDFELPGPDRRVIRWAARPVGLPDGFGQLHLFHDVTREVDREREHERLANTDHLTGLLNRRGAEDAIHRELARSRRTGAPLSFAIFDLDHFKRINDTFGHATGDTTLREVSRLVAASSRATDVPVRWGGEELLVVLAGTPLAGAHVFAERVRAAVEALDCAGLPRLTISAGVSELLPGELTPDEAIARADARMYEAKAGGRNQVR
jgi:two-component system cell cycle response regulator